MEEDAGKGGSDLVLAGLLGLIHRDIGNVLQGCQHRKPSPATSTFKFDPAPQGARCQAAVRNAKPIESTAAARGVRHAKEWAGVSSAAVDASASGCTLAQCCWAPFFFFAAELR